MMIFVDQSRYDGFSADRSQVGRVPDGLRFDVRGPLTSLQSCQLSGHHDSNTPRSTGCAPFGTPQAIGAELAVSAREAGFAFRAVVADSAYGDQDGFRGELAEAGLPFVMALKPRHGTWAYGPDARTPADAARVLAWDGPGDPGDWQPVTRTFRDGHAETWWAADARLGWWGPDGFTRLVVATADPGTLPDKATWYLAANLPRPGGPREADSVHPAADLAEITRIYGIRHWIEQSYKQVNARALHCGSVPSWFLE